MSSARAAHRLRQIPAENGSANPLLSDTGDKRTLQLLEDPLYPNPYRALTTEKLEPALHASIQSSQGSVSQW